MKRFAPLLLVLLAACVPTTQYYPPGVPILYPTDYQTQADPETGLITAVRNERGGAANLRYRFPYDDDEDDDDFPLGLGFSLLVPVPITSPEQTIITIVIRRAEPGASLIYSTQGPDGTSSHDAERLMRGVVADLNTRFLASQPQERLEPVTP